MALELETSIQDYRTYVQEEDCNCVACKTTDVVYKRNTRGTQEEHKRRYKNPEVLVKRN